MKMSIFLFLIGALSGICHAQKMEPYGDMAKPVTMIFNEDMATLMERIVQNLEQLQGVEKDSKTGKPRFERKVWRPSLMTTNTTQMDLESITVWWTPPKASPQKVSNGGGNIKPLRSEIWIVVGCLKTNRQASVIRLRREWTYNIRAHIPYTEIPLCRTERKSGGSYLSDRDWLHQLAPEKEHPGEYDDVVYASNILQVLRTIPLPPQR
ncbi:MAG: hypothetical protein WCH86_06485 [Kiritimatiellales bacterium]